LESRECKKHKFERPWYVIHSEVKKEERKGGGGPHGEEEVVSVNGLPLFLLAFVTSFTGEGREEGGSRKDKQGREDKKERKDKKGRKNKEGSVQKGRSRKERRKEGRRKEFLAGICHEKGKEGSNKRRNEKTK
jgi:hypothetical protein